MSCESCTEYKIPHCLETLYIESFFDAGIDYVVTFTNPHGTKKVLTKTANYAGLLVIDIEDDLGEGYFFYGNTYIFQAYESQTDFECDNPMSLCGYEDCISIEVYKASGNEDDHTINCCE